MDTTAHLPAAWGAVGPLDAAQVDQFERAVNARPARPAARSVASARRTEASHPVLRASVARWPCGFPRPGSPSGRIDQDQRHTVMTLFGSTAEVAHRGMYLRASELPPLCYLMGPVCGRTIGMGRSAS